MGNRADLYQLMEVMLGETLSAEEKRKLDEVRTELLKGMMEDGIFYDGTKKQIMEKVCALLG